MSNHYLHQKCFFKRWICDKADFTPTLKALLTDPDHVFNNKESIVLKHDLGSDVVKIRCDQKNYVVKRYNIKNSWHASRRMLRPTRAIRNWHNAQILAKLQINTPKPVAIVENRFGCLRFRSYYIMEYRSEHDICALNQYSEHDIKLTVNQIVRVLAKLHKQGYVHGDMKCSNILFSKECGVYLLDLDGMHRPRFFKQRKRDKDQNRLKKCWRDNPVITAILEQAYSQFLKKK